MRIKGQPEVYVLGDPPSDTDAAIGFPRQDLPDYPRRKGEDYKSPMWFCNNLRYIASFYNISNAFMQPIVYSNQQNTTSNAYGSYNQAYASYGYVTEMVENMMYYFGWQPNLDYAFMTQDTSTGNLQAPWIKGQDVAKLVDYVVGRIKLMINMRNVTWSATPANETALTSRQAIYDKLLMILSFQPIFDEMEKQGIVYQPAGPRMPKFKNKFEINEFLDKNYNEYSAELDQKIALATWIDDRWSEAIGLAAKYVLCTGWGCAEHILKDDGQYTWEVFPSYQAIVDLRKDSDFNRYAQFRARVFFMTPTEIFATYPELTKAQRDEINKMATSSTFGAPWNGTSGVLWWSYAPTGTVGVVRGYWDTLREEKKREVDGKIVGVPNQEEGMFISDLCQGTLIGNKYLLRYGYCDNVVENILNPSDIQKPISIFIPNMMSGVSRSFVGRYKFLQSELDALEFKQREFIGRAKGKVLFIDSTKVGGGVDIKELIEDLTNLGVTVMERNGEENPDDKTPPVIPVDLTLDSAGITTLWKITVEKRKYLNELAGWSEIAAGQQNFYVGAKVQDQTIGNSSISLSGIVDGFVQWLEDNMQYACDVQKLNPDTWRIERAIGEAGVEFLKMDKGMLFSRNQVQLRVNDNISDAKRAELMQMAVARTSTGDPQAMLDFAQMQKLPTWTLVSDYLENSLRRSMEQQEKMKLQEEARANMANAIQQDAANQAMVEQTKMREEGATQRAEGNARTALAKEAMSKEGVTPEQAIAQLS